MSEADAVRHFTNLSRRNFGVDTGFYPLGSCTMKYNPRLNEALAGRMEIADAHPETPASASQGLLRLLSDTERILCGLSGMDRVSFQPAAGAHGELTGLLMIRAWLKDRGEVGRDKVLVPDSSHGTNPATSSMAGFTVRQIPSDPDGLVDLDALRKECAAGGVAALMLTNPNTLGLFEKRIPEIADIVHKAGGLLYYDGANFNALMGICRPGDMDFDVMQFNLHKTFSTPHGGGGPGSGPVAVKGFLADFLPGPVVADTGAGLVLETPVKSIGRVRTFFGNFGVVVRAWAYCLTLGRSGLKRASEIAVLNANYLLRKMEGIIPVPHAEQGCLHEFVASASELAVKGVRAMDIAKALIDKGYHPPTVYFPLIVKEALMIEPTETESRETLDLFVEDFAGIIREGLADPEALHAAPKTTPVGRVDEALAAREMMKTAGT
jgi:glycine dehydrogenase subunit 2